LYRHVPVVTIFQQIPPYHAALYPMASVLFTHSYFLRFDPKQYRTGQPYPPLGTLYAAAVLREAGHSVGLHDTMFSASPEEIVRRLEQERPSYLVVYDDGFNYLTKMCLTNMREAAFRMIHHAKDFGCRVIVSSSDATDHAERYLDEGADAVITGEAEVSLRELLEVYDANGTPDAVAGIIFREHGQTVRTAKREVMRDLDALPMPAYDLVNIEPYKQMWKRRHGYFSLNVATTRGCPFSCNWCAKPIYGNRYNSRSPKMVAQELLTLKRLFDFDHIWFCDDIFGLKPGWAEEFAKEVRESGLSFRFKIQSRADLLLKPGTAEALALAGCETVWMGAESGSQKILNAMDKGITVTQIRQAVRTVKQHGMKPALFLQFGYPGETKDDIEATVQMLLELMPSDIGISVSYPLPGTLFYENVKNDLQAKANWTDSDDLALMFRSTYRPEFYKRLHRFVHKRFRARASLDSLRAMMAKPLSNGVAEIRSGAVNVVFGTYYLLGAAFDALRLKVFYRAHKKAVGAP
jgi:radical SAM superfamily enzyme YgiQ (UPF0313 family)